MAITSGLSCNEFINTLSSCLLLINPSALVYKISKIEEPILEIHYRYQLLFHFVAVSLMPIILLSSDSREVQQIMHLSSCQT